MSKLFGSAGVLCGFVISISGFACDPRCSDGFAELEQCEPEPADDAATPGDDRPGYLTCSDGETGASQTCAPGSGCCGSGSQCATDPQECATPFWFATCDGPEDCGMAEQCWLGDRAIECSAEATPYFNVRCHTDADCLNASENPCVNGYCLGDPDNRGEPVAG